MPVITVSHGSAYAIVRATQQVNGKLETKASSHEGQCIPAGSRVSLPTRVLNTVSIITMHLFPPNLRPIVYALQILDRNFANLVAPPTDGSAKYLVRYKVHLVA